MKVISNSSTLIALKNIKRLDLVKKIFKTIIIPDEVYHEVFLHDKQSYPFIEQKSIKSTLAFEILNKTLGRGESACIVLYKEINADLLILDDLRARKIAESHDIKLTGLLGILKIAKDKKQDSVSIAL